MWLFVDTDGRLKCGPVYVAAKHPAFVAECVKYSKELKQWLKLVAAEP